MLKYNLSIQKAQVEILLVPRIPDQLTLSSLAFSERPSRCGPSFFCLGALVFYFWLRWVFIAVLGLSLVVVSRGYSSLWCVGFSLWWLLLLWSTGSRHTSSSVIVACGLSSRGSWALEHRLSSCGARAQLLCGVWDLPGPGIEPMSPALAGGILTTAPPEKSSSHLIINSRGISS